VRLREVQHDALYVLLEVEVGQEAGNRHEEEVAVDGVGPLPAVGAEGVLHERHVRHLPREQQRAQDDADEDAEARSCV
jgi:hypothetical protein